MDKIEGFLEVGCNEQGEVVVNHPDLKPDENGVGHIVFSSDQARHLAGLLVAKALEAESRHAGTGSPLEGLSPETRISEEQSRQAANMAEGIGCKLPAEDLVRIVCEEYVYWSDGDEGGGVSIGALSALGNIIGRIATRNKFEPLREIATVGAEQFKPKYSQEQILELVSQGKVSIWDAAAYQFIPDGFGKQPGDDDRWSRGESY